VRKVPEKEVRDEVRLHEELDDGSRYLSSVDVVQERDPE